MYYAIATNKGKEKDAAARVAGQPMPQYAELAVGDSGGAPFDPLETQVSLINEVWRGPVNGVFVHPDNANWVVIEAMVPAAAGPFDIREVGIYDSEGDLVIVASQALTEKPDPAGGSTKDLYVRIICEITNAIEVVQQVDPTLVYVTQDMLDVHPARRDNPHVVTTAQIGAETPAGAQAKVDAYLPTSAGIFILDDVAPAGWVMADDGTIGSAVSGASNRANADCEALFKVLWKWDNAVAPVTGGRGASAQADWDADKKIQLGTILGRAIAVAGNGSGLTARSLGQVLGEESHQLTVPGMPYHNHPNVPLNAPDTDRGEGPSSHFSLDDTGTTGATGGGLAHNNMQPTVFFNVIIKL